MRTISNVEVIVVKKEEELIEIIKSLLEENDASWIFMHKEHVMKLGNKGTKTRINESIYTYNIGSADNMYRISITVSEVEGSDMYRISTMNYNDSIPRNIIFIMNNEIEITLETQDVPEDICPLVFMANMKERLDESWVFISKKQLYKMEQTADYEWNSNNRYIIRWEENKYFPFTIVEILQSAILTTTYEFISIHAEDIRFKFKANIPKRIVFLI